MCASLLPIAAVIFCYPVTSGFYFHDSLYCRSYVTDESIQMELQCVSTTTKGRGMTSFINIPLASLIHKEDPYAAV